jgi:hypothetical protein
MGFEVKQGGIRPPELPSGSRITIPGPPVLTLQEHDTSGRVALALPQDLPNDRLLSFSWGGTDSASAAVRTHFPTTMDGISKRDESP